MDKLNEKDFENKINGKDLTLVDFYATWCGPCEIQGEILNKIKTSRNNDLDIIKINVDNNSELAERYEIESIPTLIFFKNGEIIKRKVGVTSEEEIIDIVNNN